MWVQRLLQRYDADPGSTGRELLCLRSSVRPWAMDGGIVPRNPGGPARAGRRLLGQTAVQGDPARRTDDRDTTGRRGIYHRRDGHEPATRRRPELRSWVQPIHQPETRTGWRRLRGRRYRSRYVRGARGRGRRSVLGQRVAGSLAGAIRPLEPVRGAVRPPSALDGSKRTGGMANGSRRSRHRSVRGRTRGRRRRATLLRLDAPDGPARPYPPRAHEPGRNRGGQSRCGSLPAGRYGACVRRPADTLQPPLRRGTPIRRRTDRASRRRPSVGRRVGQYRSDRHERSRGDNGRTRRQWPPEPSPTTNCCTSTY